MAWNHKSRILAMAIAIQPTPGVFNAPSAPDDLIAVGTVTNGEDIISADDPTATGSVWQAPRIYLGETGNAGATAPLRGPGGTAPPAQNEWVLGRVLQAAGFAEVINDTEITGAPTAGTTTSITLAGAASSVDDLYIGFPIQHAQLGTGLKANSLVMDYNGTTKLATLAETAAAAMTGTDYRIPPCLVYQLGTLSGTPALLSVSIWRDKKRYDYRDCSPTSFTLDMPVANEQNAVFPSVEFALKGLPHAEADEVSPDLPASLLSGLAPYRNGKFSLDKVKLGHQSTRFGVTFETAGASNAHAEYGQDAYEVMSGQRTLDMDINQMAVADFDIRSRVKNQTVISSMSLWGTTQGNRFGFLAPELVLDPLSPGDRNGFVNLTGNASFQGVDKGATLAIWWD